MPVTLRDVAAKAGVTPTVVSHVLHQRASTVRVSIATAARIRDAAVEMGYRLNIQGRNFRDQKTHMIAVVHGMGFARPIFGRESRYFGMLMDGIIQSAFNHGYSVTLCPTLLGDNPSDAMSDGRFDGLIWYNTIPSAQNQAMIERCTVPIVLIHSGSDAYAGRFPSVICDNKQGVELGIDHLISKGHETIAFGLEGPDQSQEAVARKNHFVLSMEKRGLTVSDDSIYTFDHSDFTVRDYLSRPLRHTAIFTYNEGLGSEVIRVARDVGVGIPDDLSVIAFDSTPFCDELRPRLTAVSQPLDTLGESAVDLLVRRMSESTAASPHIITPCGLDIRESVGICNPTRKS